MSTSVNVFRLVMGASATQFDQPRTRFGKRYVPLSRAVVEHFGDLWRQAKFNSQSPARPEVWSVHRATSVALPVNCRYRLKLNRHLRKPV